MRQAERQCDCLQQIEKKMGGEMQEVDLWSGRTLNSIRRQNGRRKKTTWVVHSHCPWCGKAYRTPTNAELLGGKLKKGEKG